MNILTINGLEGVEKASVFEALQKFGDFGTRYYFFSCGNFFEETAKAKGYDSFEDALLDMSSNEPSLDTLLDEEIARLVDEYDKIVIEGFSPWLAVKKARHNKTNRKEVVNILLSCSNSTRIHRILKKEKVITQVQAKLRLTEYEQNQLARIRTHYGFSSVYQLFQKGDFSAEIDVSKAFPSFIASLIIMRFKISVQAT